MSTVAGVRGSVGPMGSTVVTVVGGERVEAFVPKPLPPGRGLDLGRLLPAICRAHWELGRLVELGARPDADCLGILFAAKEAVFSSRIEGIEASVSEVLRWGFGLGAEAGNRPATEETEAARTHWITVWTEFGPAFRSRRGFCAKCTASCCPNSGGRCRGSIGVRRTGSAGPGRVSRGSSRRRPTGCPT